MDNHVKAVEYLLENKAKSIPNQEGMTPEQFAHDNNLLEISSLFNKKRPSNNNAIRKVIILYY